MDKKGHNKIALFSMAVGKDRIYFDSVRRYFPYNRENFGQDEDVDYLLLTDQTETIEGVMNISCPASVWPFAAMLKNNNIADYLNKSDRWNEYTHIFFIDADFAIGDRYDFFSHDFVFAKPYWNAHTCGGFYGGKTEYFRRLCDLFYGEIRFVYENKLSVPHNLDEHYLGMFGRKYHTCIHWIMMNEANTLVFMDDEDLDEKIRQAGIHLFLHPHKSKGRANRNLVTGNQNQELECIVNLEEQYIFNNHTYDFGRLYKIDETNYRILWSKNPEERDVLNIETQKIIRQITNEVEPAESPAISIVMPVYNVHLSFLQESMGSILKQTFTDFELIIIDDGSTETEALDWLKTVKDRRIKLIHNPHNFIDSLNRGIAESKGKYIARMDADDIMFSHRLQTQFNYMEEHPEIDICGSRMEVFGKGSEMTQSYTDHKQIVASLLTGSSIAHPTVILRKSTLCKDGTDIYRHDYIYAEDYKLWTDLAERGLQFFNIPEALLKYRSSENQVTIAHYKEIQITSLKIQKEYAEAVMEKIAGKDEKMLPFFNSLIDLVNEDVIDFNQLLKIVSTLYIDYLQI
jgi:glycosyltransferase involved in cell wall biosynthesis